MSQVVGAEQLTKDELAQVRVGVCPKCGEELALIGKIEADPNEFMMLYNEGLGEWEHGDDVELDYICQVLQCQGLGCSAEYDVSIVRPDDE